MAYEVKILADSVNPVGCRLFTVQATYPRFVHAELMTHRAFSRNAASSRAIPVEKVLNRVLEEPAAPIYWGKNQKGMQAEEELDREDALWVASAWLRARDFCGAMAEAMHNRGAHKQIVNRILEPFCWMTTIITATDWANFFGLRCHQDAQPEIKEIADRICYAYTHHEPSLVPRGQCHLPLTTLQERRDLTERQIKQLATARCARVSYLTHDGRRDLQADYDLHDRLKASGHWSPFEHVARALGDHEHRGNFRGWHPYRKEFPAAQENRTRYPIPAEGDYRQWRTWSEGEAPFTVWEE